MYTHTHIYTDIYISVTHTYLHTLILLFYILLINKEAIHKFFLFREQKNSSIFILCFYPNIKIKLKSAKEWDVFETPFFKYKTISKVDFYKLWTNFRVASFNLTYDSSDLKWKVYISAS